MVMDKRLMREIDARLAPLLRTADAYNDRILAAVTVAGGRTLTTHDIITNAVYIVTVRELKMSNDQLVLVLQDILQAKSDEIFEQDLDAFTSDLDANLRSFKDSSN